MADLLEFFESPITYINIPFQTPILTTYKLFKLEKSNVKAKILTFIIDICQFHKIKDKKKYFVRNRNFFWFKK